MPIILAIEPDRRQRRALDAVVHERVGAELILADTTEHALEAIGNRMPDLVLVPALLSPQDDAALAAALRVIAAAAHVRTLTIPVLANESKTEAPSGLLSRWRRGRSASQAPDGCDPHLFAEQISAYLAEAAAERAALRRDDDDLDDAPVVERPVVDPAVLEAAIAEAVSLSHAVAHDRPADTWTADRALDDHALAHETLDDRVVVDRVMTAPAPVDVASAEYSAAEQAIADLRLVADAATPTVAEHEIVAAGEEAIVETREHDSLVHDTLVEVREAYADSEGAFAADEDIELSGELFDAEPAGVVAMPGFAASALVDEPIVAEEIAVEEEIAVAAAAAPEPGTEAHAFEPAALDEPVVAEAVSDEPVLEENAIEVEDAAVEEVALVAAAENELAIEALAFDINPPEEFLVDELVETPADSAEPVAALAADLAPVEMLAVDVARTDAFTIDEFAVDDLVVEEFLFEEAGAAIVAATSQAPAIDEPTVAPHVLEARAAFEQAEVLALAETDDAVLTEFADFADYADHTEPDPDDVEPWISASLARLYSWPVLEGVPAEIVIEPAKPEPVRPQAAAASHVREREWTELVASLRQDIERRRVEPITPKAKRPSKKAKPAQDEWGFFDPEQCGFAALLAKLDEITDPTEERDLPRH